MSIKKPTCSRFWPRTGGECGLFLAKLVERHDFGGLPRRLWRLFGGTSFGKYFRGQGGSLRRRDRDFELKSELDRGVGEARHRGKRDRQLLRPVLKAQGDREFLVSDLEPAELMLKDDRHLFRVFVEQVVR